MPYLGKNDHPADIKNVQIVELEETTCQEQEISGMFPKRKGELCLLDDEDDLEVFKYEENLPIALNGYTNLYEYEKFCYTNMPVTITEEIVYKEANRRYTKTIAAIYQTHLDQRISFLHEPSEGRFSLSLDLSEVFKPVIVFKTIFDLVNNRRLQVEKHFDKQVNYCVLNEEGRKIFIESFEERLERMKILFALSS